MVLAQTVKGRGFAEVKDKNGWHGRPLPADMAQRAVAGLGGQRDLRVITPRPDRHDAPPRPAAAAVTLPRYEVASRVATRKAYGDALVALGARPEVVALDGEVGNSTYAGEFAAYPGRFFEMFIAEQQLIAAAVGLSVRGYVPFAPTFAAFFSRGYDFLRMAGISGANIKVCGPHAGVEIGPDGPSRMALEDLAALRAIHGSTVLYPADASAAAALPAEMAATPGIVYLRATRSAWPVIYPVGESFPVGGSKVLRAADDLAAEGSRRGSSTCTPSSPSTVPRWLRRPRRPAGGWSSPRTTTRRAASAPPCSRRTAGPTCRCGPGSARSAACRAPAPRTS